MTQRIHSLQEVASQYGAIVLDQWGVLHDGSAPYPHAIECLNAITQSGTRLAVLSNSGKRAAPNAARIAAMGFSEELFEQVMTSGEALWRDVQSGEITERHFLPIERANGDAANWAEGLDIVLETDLGAAEAILLMGLPDGHQVDDWHDLLDRARYKDLTIYCSNPDRASPRSTGVVTSPGALAFAYQDAGGRVEFYGKPHKPIFRAVQTAVQTDRLLMVGDSLEHDIAGAQNAGWDSLLVLGGLYANDFAGGSHNDTLARLLKEKACAPPQFTIGELR